MMQSLSGASSSDPRAAGGVYQGDWLWQLDALPGFEDTRTSNKPPDDPWLSRDLQLTRICALKVSVAALLQFAWGLFFLFFSVVSLGSCSVIKRGHTDNPLNMLTVVLKIAQ